MSDTSASYQCTYISADVQYTSSLICRTSDLIQRYSGAASAPEIPPEYDFELTKPVLQILLTSALPGTSADTLKQAVLNNSTKWYVNDVEISFNDTTGLSTAMPGFPTGTFKKIPANSVADYPFGGLQFLKNIVSGLGGVSGVIKCQLAFTNNSDVKTIRDLSYPIGVKEFAVDGYELEVYTDGSFVLDSSNTSVLCRARLWKGATKVYDSNGLAAGKTLRWYTYDDATGDWGIVAAESGKFSFNVGGELTVTADAVPTFLNVSAAVFSDSTKTSYKDAEATDVATIHDTTDSLYIEPNPTPSDGTLRAGESTPDGVLFQPKVFDTKLNTEVSGFKFKFICMSPAGTILNGTSAQGGDISGSGYDSPSYGVVGTPDNTELLTAYKVPRSMFEGINFGPTVLILAFKAA